MPTQPPIQCVAGILTGVKRLEHEADNLPQTSAEVKNSRNCTSTATGTTFLVLTFTVSNTEYIVSNEGKDVMKCCRNLMYVQ